METHIESILNLRNRHFSRDCYFYYIVPDYMQSDIANHFNNDEWKAYASLITFKDRTNYRKTMCKYNVDIESDSDSRSEEESSSVSDEDSEEDDEENNFAVAFHQCLRTLFPGLDVDMLRMCLAFLLISVLIWKIDN